MILTVKNDGEGCAHTLESLAVQTRMPDEVVVVDGGSTDDTLRRIQSFQDRLPNLRIIECPGANIAQGREVATRESRGPIIASIDAGCRASPNWLENLVAPLEGEAGNDVSAGIYRIEAHSIFEEVVGLTTMRGQLTPFDPATFNPSGRSLGYTKEVWRRAGGWPTWLGFSEDTLFAHRLRSVARGWHFAGNAVVHWRPRTTFRKLARQFYHYGTGRGHTQIGAAEFRYNLRNLVVFALLTALCAFSPWFFVPAVGWFVYFFVAAFHTRASQIAGHTRTIKAYPLTLAVFWVVMISNLAGYLHGSWQRWNDAKRFRMPMEAYLAAP